MLKHRVTVTIAVVFLMLSFVFLTGCAKKATVVQPSEEAQVVPQQTGETDAEKAAREKAAAKAQSDEGKASAEKTAPAGPLAGLEFVYFDYDKYAVKADSRDTLKKLYDKLSATPTIKILIEGNCDERGTVEYNLALGERRAKAAMKYLVDMGIKEDRLSTLSNGKEKPVATGSNEEAWAKNRNAHFIIKK